MKVAYDLHIHSCLSPGADDDMTPANIVGMAKLKELSMISLTDHNCGNNLEAMAYEMQSTDMIFIPGIEVTSFEEVHLLVYFEHVNTAVGFSEMIYNSLPNVDNRPDIFGNQIIINNQDVEIGSLNKLLLQATPFSIDEIVKQANKVGGCVVPAHINRSSNSLLSNLGCIPKNLFNWVEIFNGIPCPPIDERLRVLYSSDAHRLGDISEPNQYLENIFLPKDLISLFNEIFYPFK